MPFAVPDPVSSTLHAALGGLALRQRVVADNIANVDTPHYRASSVVFEDSLRAAVRDGSVMSGPVTPAVEATRTPVGANGNNVDLRKETMAAMQSLFQYQMMTRAVSDREALLRTVATGA